MKMKRNARADCFEEQAQKEIMRLYRKLSSEPPACRDEKWNDPGRFYALPKTAWYKAQCISFKYKYLHFLTALSALLLIASFLYILRKFWR